MRKITSQWPSEEWASSSTSTASETWNFLWRLGIKGLGSTKGNNPRVAQPRGVFPTEFKSSSSCLLIKNQTLKRRLPNRLNLKKAFKVEQAHGKPGKKWSVYFCFFWRKAFGEKKTLQWDIKNGMYEIIDAIPIFPLRCTPTVRKQLTKSTTAEIFKDFRARVFNEFVQIHKSHL